MRRVASLPLQQLEVQCHAGVVERLRLYGEKCGVSRADAFSHAMVALSFVDATIMQGRRVGVVIGNELADYESYWNMRIPRRMIPLDLATLGMGLSDRIVVFAVRAASDSCDIYDTYMRVYQLPSEIVMARAVALLTLIDNGVLVVKQGKEYYALEASVFRSPNT